MNMQTRTDRTEWGQTFTFQWNDERIDHELADDVLNSLRRASLKNGKTYTLTVF